MKSQDLMISFLSGVTNFGSSRYVKSFSRKPLDLEMGRTELASAEEKEANDLVMECAKLVSVAADIYPVLKELEETIFLGVEDLNDLRFTVTLRKGNVDVRTGWDITKRPTLIVPLFKKNLLNLKQILSDKKVNKTEIYRIARVLFVSFMKGLYDADFLFTSGDKRYLKLDNNIHVELVEMPGVVVDGFPGAAKATVLNVNGEWLVFEGFQGTPKMKVTCNLDQALQYYYILMIEMKKAKNAAQLAKAFDKYMKLRKDTCQDVYKK
jgi:hypothetical protein